MMFTTNEFSLADLAQRAESAGLHHAGFLDRSLRDQQSLQDFRRYLIDHCPSAFFRSYLEGGLQHWTRRWEYPWVLAQVARFAQEVPGCRLLDDACGVNATAYLLGTLGCRVTGTDLNDASSAEDDLPSEAWIHPDATSVAGSMEFCAADSLCLPFPDQVFDGGYSISSLEHMSDPVLAVRELVRVVRPGGLVVVTMDVSEQLNPIAGEGNVNRQTFPAVQEVLSDLCVTYAPARYTVTSDVVRWSVDCRRGGSLRRWVSSMRRSMRGEAPPLDFSVWCASFIRR